jgi:hypothetical protein
MQKRLTWLFVTALPILEACAGDLDLSGESGAHLESASSAWGVAYVPPAGYRAVEQEPFTFYSSPSDGALIIVGRGVLSTEADALNALAGFAAQEKLQGGTPIAGPAIETQGQQRYLTATYSAFGADGTSLRLRYVTVFSAFGTSAGLLGVAKADKYEAMEAKVNAMAKSVTISEPALSPNAGQLVGTWSIIKSTSLSSGSGSSSTTTLVFSAGGEFSYDSESSISIFTSSGSGLSTFGGGHASQSSARGRYSVIGRTLVLATDQGKAVLPFQLGGNQLIVAGKTFMR